VKNLQSREVQKAEGKTEEEQKREAKSG